MSPAGLVERPQTQREILNSLHIDPRTAQSLEITPKHVALTVTLFIVGCVMALGIRTQRISPAVEVAFHYISGSAGAIPIIAAVPRNRTAIERIALRTAASGARFVVVAGPVDGETRALMCSFASESSSPAAGISWVVAAQPALDLLPECGFSSSTAFSLIFTAESTSAIASDSEWPQRNRELNRHLSRSHGPARVILSHRAFDAAAASGVKGATHFVGNSRGRLQVQDLTRAGAAAQQLKVAKLLLNPSTAESGIITAWDELLA